MRDVGRLARVTPSAPHATDGTFAILRVDRDGRVIAATEPAKEVFVAPEGRACHRVVAAKGPDGRVVCTAHCAAALARGEARFAGRVRASVRGRACSMECHAVGDEVVVVLKHRAGADGPPIGRLTARQVDVMRLVAKGLTNRTIALRLGLQPCTVRTHVEQSLSRLGAKSRAEAVVRALASDQL